MIVKIKNTVIFVGLLTSVLTPSCNKQKEDKSMKIEWSNKLVMPDLNGKENPGTAGAYIGINNDHLIISGGAFFPDTLPWNGGKKHWSTNTYILNLKKGINEWKVLTNTLPHAIAYGSSVSTPKGILCIGGSDADKCYDNTYLMTYEGDSAKFVPWVSLPYPLSNCCASIVGSIVFVAGGQKSIANGEASHSFLSIDINKPEDGWKELPSWNGPARGYAVGIAKMVNNETLFYLFSGRNYGSDIAPEVLSDGYVYNANTSEWKKLEGNFPLMAATGIELDNSGMILLAGGTDGSIFMKEMELKRKISSYIADNTQNDSTLYYKNELKTFFESVKGFDNIVRLFDTSTNTIVDEENIPYPLPLTTTTISSDENIYIVSGEIRPGVRSPYIIKGTFIK